MQNIQVIERAFKLLEAIAVDPERGHTLTELARQSGLKPPTAARIVGTLNRLGYLDRLGLRQGYMLGAGFRPLAQGAARPLAARAQDYLSRFARQNHEYVGLAIYSGGIRRVIGFCDSELSIKVELPAEQNNAAADAPGRILLSLMPESEQKAFFRKYDLGDWWPEAAKRREFLNELSLIQQAELCEVEHEEFLELAVPVMLLNPAPAAVFTRVPKHRLGERKGILLYQLRRIASRLR